MKSTVAPPSVTFKIKLIKVIHNSKKRFHNNVISQIVNATWMDLLTILVTSTLENAHVNLMCLETSVMKVLKVTLDFLENLKVYVVLYQIYHNLKNKFTYMKIYPKQIFYLFQNVTAMRMDLSVLLVMKLLENVLVMNISLVINVTNLLKNILAFPHQHVCIGLL